MSDFSDKMSISYDDAVELDLYGLAIADGNGVVLQVDGSLDADISVGGRLTRDFLPLIGMDEDVSRLRQYPTERLRMPKVSLGTDDKLVNLTLYWAVEKERYLLVAMDSVDASADMLPTIRLARSNKLLTEQLEIQRKHYRTVYENTPFYGVMLFHDGQVSVSTIKLRETLGISFGQEGGHAEAMLMQPIIMALKAKDLWEPLWGNGTSVDDIDVELPVVDEKSERFSIAANRIVDSETGLKEASIVLTRH